MEKGIGARPGWRRICRGAIRRSCRQARTERIRQRLASAGGGPPRCCFKHLRFRARAGSTRAAHTAERDRKKSRRACRARRARPVKIARAEPPNGPAAGVTRFRELAGLRRAYHVQVGAYVERRKMRASGLRALPKAPPTVCWMHHPRNAIHARWAADLFRARFGGFDKARARSLRHFEAAARSIAW